MVAFLFLSNPGRRTKHVEDLVRCVVFAQLGLFCFIWKEVSVEYCVLENGEPEAQRLVASEFENKMPRHLAGFGVPAVSAERDSVACKPTCTTGWTEGGVSHTL